jgi:hypothetical protein
MGRYLKFFVLTLVLFSPAGVCHGASPDGNQPPQQSAVAAPEEGAAISIPETTYNFGNIGEVADVSHDFTVKNTGKSTLLIDRVQPG